MRRSWFFTLGFLQKIPTISHIARKRLDEFFFLGICVCGGYWWSVFEFLVVLFPSCEQVCSDVAEATMMIPTTQPTLTHTQSSRRQAARYATQLVKYNPLHYRSIERR